MRRFRLFAAGASVLATALVLSACGGGGQPAATSAPPPTTAPAKPAAASPAVSPAASPSASPSVSASPSPAAKPAASPAAATAASPSASPAVAAGGPKPTVKMGSANFPEQVILGELYSQILEANGYTIERHLNLGTREIVEPALESGQIDMYPEYLATAEAFLAKDQSKASSDPAATAQALQTVFTPKNITVLAYSPAQDENGFVVTQDTAKKYNNLTKLSDLQPVANQLVLGATPECPQRPFCLIGLMQTYGLNFKDFRPLDTGGPLTVQALLGGQIDVGLLFTTDANITLNNFVLLEDDKHLQLADNVAPVVRNDILNRASDLKTLADRVSQTLTTADLTDLNKQVSIDHRDAKDAAADYLKSKNLVR